MVGKERDGGDTWVNMPMIYSAAGLTLLETLYSFSLTAKQECFFQLLHYLVIPIYLLLMS